jgi:hypothetical protein
MTRTAKACVVLIANADLLSALQADARVAGGEVIAVTDAEPLRALEVITTRRPDVIALERGFAATPRGIALMSRVKADPSLSHTEVRVIVSGAELGGSPKPADAPSADPQQPIPTAPEGPSQPLDQQGTRRARRFTIAGVREVLVDGKQAVLVDLSVHGAQLLSTTVLRPNQRVRVTLGDEQATIRCTAIVAWASFEIPSGSGPRYRAGLEFFNADAVALDAFCARHTVP